MSIYLIMHKNQIIAKAKEERVIEVINKALCPNAIFVGASLETWLATRSIDVHRSNSRQLFKALRLKNDANMEEIIKVGHGITINDNWWIQSEDENLNYNELKQYNQDFANISFNGFSPKIINHINDIKGYTQLGTTGSYEKTWRYIDNAWYMYKHGSKSELISEYYSYCFLDSLGVNIASYSVWRQKRETGLIDECIISKDFSENGYYDFEPFANYFYDNEDYDYIIPKLSQMESLNSGLNLVNDYVQMCFYDALLFNVDRHNMNVGFLRDSDNGSIIGLSPYFDYNLSLSSAIPDVPLHFTNENCGLMRYFTSNDACMEVIKPCMPKLNDIKNAIKVAEYEAKEAFPKDDFNYALFEKYITNAFEFFLRKMKDRAKENSTDCNMTKY